MKTKRRLLPLAAAMAMLLPIAPLSASANPSDKTANATGGVTITDPVPAGFQSWNEVFEVQGRMNDAIAAITAAADRLPDSGYGAATAAPEDGQVNLYWNGQVPAEVEAAIAEQRKNIPIVVRHAKYSRKELLRNAAILGASPDVVQVGPMFDASALQLRAKPGKSGAFRSTGQQATALAQQKITVDVVVIGEAGEGTPLTRQNDSPAYWAGARTTVGPNICTTGFGVYHGGTTRILYAAHCQASGTVFDGGGDAIGNITGRNTTRDTSLIAGPGGNRMWDGPWNEVSFSKLVQGASFSGFGNWLCTSGSASGIRCNIRVLANDQVVYGRQPMVVAQHQSGQNAAGQGDSGGPVMEIPNPNNGKVIAKGIISTGIDGYQVGCTGQPLSGRVCFSVFAYADVTQTLAYYGASLVTG